jgi:sec-independent protein translocase protein TatB
MLNLDPAKLLVIAVVAIILLGPDRLPQVARQAGAAWRSFNEFRHRMEREVRDTMPDLPSTTEIARLARSPTALLNHLSSMSDSTASPNGDGEPSTNGDGHGEPSTNGDGPVIASDADDDGPTGDEPAAEPLLESPMAPAAPEPAAYDEPRPEMGSAARRVPSDPGVVAPGDPTLN